MNKALKLFDINAYVGRPNQPKSEGWHETIDTLLQEMAYYGIDKAIITHFAAKEIHPDTGNRETLKFTTQNPDLMPAWSFIPSIGKKSDAPQAVKTALKAGAKLFRYYPNENFCPFNEYAIGDFLEILEDKRIPLLVDFSTKQGGEFKTEWDNIINVCKKYRNLPVITSEFRIRSNRMLFRALALCDNLRVCTSAVWLYKNIDYIVREFGSYRLIFGTFNPVWDPAIPVSMLMYAEISDQEKTAIGSGNIEKLFSDAKI